MPWNAVWPDGAVSVRANRTKGNQNTTYIDTTMGNSIVGTNTAATRDHFWNVGSNEDGRHRFVQSPAFTSTAPAPDDVYPVIGTGMDSVLFSKLLTSTQSTAQQDVNPFYRNASAIMQVLGIRAMGVFNGGAASPSQANVVYSHNLALQAAGTPGIVWNSTGLYTITFATALPSNAYLVLGGAIRNGSAANELLFEVQGAAAVNSVKSTTTLKIMFRSDGGTVHDPLQAWFVCFGG